MGNELIESDEFMLHTDAIGFFNNELYSDIFTSENITSKKKCITVGDERIYGYYLEKGKDMYFADDNAINSMPFRIRTKSETDYRGDVFDVITDVVPVSIPIAKSLTYREIVDLLCRFKHTNKKHQLLYAIIALAAYVDRVNFRVSTDAGFGKDSVVNVFAQLVNSTVNLYGATFAKLEYVLLNKLIVLNELSNLKSDDLVNMQEFLLAVGAYFNNYTKRSRKTQTTQEQYDISKLSLMVFYNLPSYYTNKAQEYFDQMFTGAVINRFIPFVFDGRLTSSFEKILNPKAVMEANKDTYKKLIASINYYKANPVTEIKYKYDSGVINFPKSLMRYDRTFKTLLKYVSEYSSSQEEFDDLSKELFSCYQKYSQLLEGEKPKESLKKEAKEFGVLK